MFHLLDTPSIHSWKRRRSRFKRKENGLMHGYGRCMTSLALSVQKSGCVFLPTWTSEHPISDSLGRHSVIFPQLRRSAVPSSKLFLMQQPSQSDHKRFSLEQSHICMSKHYKTPNLVLLIYPHRNNRLYLVKQAFVYNASKSSLGLVFFGGGGVIFVFWLLQQCHCAISAFSSLSLTSM